MIGGGWALLLDGLDGYVARRSGRATPFGARLDLEVDALFVLGLSMLAWAMHVTGAWILLSGSMRYIWIASGRVWPILHRPLPRCFWRSAVCVLQIGLLLATLAPGLRSPWPTMLGGFGLGCLALSFGRDLVWILRKSEPYRG
jgi:phosphatidylglycerophosphate synthase